MQNIIDNTNNQGKDFKPVAGLLQSMAGEYFTQKLAIPGESTGKNENSVENENSVNKETLSLYYIDQYLILGKTILKYNNKSEKVKIKPRIFEYTGNDTFDELSRVLTTEIMAGAGPDIVCFKPEREFSSVNKIIASGAFADLNKLIAEDSEFDIDDYNKIINVGVYNGKRYFIPYDYNMPAFFTTEKTLKNNQIIVNDGNLTFNEFRTVTENFINSKSRKSKFLFNSELTFFNFLSLYGNQFYSNNNRNYDFSSKDSISL
jgi:ABC-type glycerol-3-phosphate transport system substrate-binding protein